MPAEWNQITAGEIAQATGATLDRGKADTVFTGLSTDSRSVGNGELFIALTGDRFDGHDFVLDVVRKEPAG